METTQRPDPNENGERVLNVTLSDTNYRLLEVLHDDVTAYIEKLIASHCDGRRKSIAYNNKLKEANNNG